MQGRDQKLSEFWVHDDGGMRRRELTEKVRHEDLYSITVPVRCVVHRKHAPHNTIQCNMGPNLR
eukprot:COSAG01_NODE_583_length_15194_cov_5.640808_8_plen_64_part_00